MRGNLFDALMSNINEPEWQKIIDAQMAKYRVFETRRWKPKIRLKTDGKYYWNWSNVINIKDIHHGPFLTIEDCYSYAMKVMELANNDPYTTR